MPTPTVSDAATSRQHFSLGTHALKQRDPTRAQAHFLAAHTLASPLVSGHALRGMAQACLQQGDSTQALALLDMARRAYLLCEDSCLLYTSDAADE